ncbi:MAG: PH domain-containing protein [Candidatus Hydrogenedentes bacterium]|nr:PH domain-containing protein [Candidatus Hydrogenedentota bacterium]
MDAATPVPEPVQEPQAEEVTVWSGHPSHAMYFGTYTLCILFCVLIVPIFIALWIWIKVRTQVYELTSQRLFFTTGILSKQREEWELYRVKDMRIEEPFKLRLFGKGNIVLETSDRSIPNFVLQAVDQPKQLSARIRQLVEERRRTRGVRELDVE